MSELEDYLRSINPQPHEQAILLYGSKYRCWLEGRYIGIFTWTKDENVGDSFQNKIISEGRKKTEVATPDKWELIPQPQ